MLRTLRFLSVLSLALLAWTARASAQCTLTDNLDGGPCCASTSPTIPYLGKILQDAQDICWRDCGVSSTRLVRGRWTQLPFIAGITYPCGEQSMRLDILGPGNVLFWRGQVRLVYSRTWAVQDMSGALRQVWRYLVNGDLTAFPAAGVAPCPLPACLATFGNRARFTGYLDVVEDCSTPGNFDYAWMMTHACDTFDHHAGFPRAGVFHPDRSYSFVAPAAGFVPGPLQPIEGTPFSPFEAMRSRTPVASSPGMMTCNYEEPANHTIAPVNQLCFCGAPGSNQFMVANFQAIGSCGSFARNPPVSPLLPGFVSMGLGAWTNPALYPGQQNLRWNAGAYDYGDACNPAIAHEAFYGVTTFGGWPAMQLVGSTIGAPLPPFFVDQASSHSVAGAVVMNIPYQPLHIMNLNH